MRAAVAIVIALAAGLFAARFLGFIVGGVLSLAWLGLKLLVIAGVAYFVLTIVSPETAQKVKEKFAGPGGSI
jgi:hypothetical protein